MAKTLDEIEAFIQTVCSRATSAVEFKGKGVFSAGTDEGRARYWAESAPEVNGEVKFRILGYKPFSGRILKKSPPSLFALELYQIQARLLRLINYLLPPSFPVLASSPVLRLAFPDHCSLSLDYPLVHIRKGGEKMNMKLKRFPLVSLSGMVETPRL